VQEPVETYHNNFAKTRMVLGEVSYTTSEIRRLAYLAQFDLLQYFDQEDDLALA
jgi:hypothetical protein